jgi:DNA-damage-inducible protein J
MKMTSTIQVQVDQQMGEDVSNLFSKMGLDVSTAVKMFFNAALQENGFPFRPQVRSSKQKISVSSRTIAQRMATIDALIGSLPSTITDEEVKKLRVQRYESIT